jgi:hypothetical protein
MLEKARQRKKMAKNKREGKARGKRHQLRRRARDED